MALKTVSCAIAALALSAGLASAQQSSLRINEVLRNPPGSTDAKWQYIELFGCPNTDLSGLAVIVVVDNGTVAEVDESFVFPASSKYKTNSSGYFVIWNSDDDTDLGTQANSTHSGIYQKLPASIQVNPANAAPTNLLGANDFAAATNRYEASFEEIGNVPVIDTAGTIASNGSMTVFLLNLSDNSLSAGQVEKDDVWDANRDGVPEAAFQSLTVIDEIAVSDGANHEYTMSEANELDFTPGFNPDCFIRVNDVLPANEIAPPNSGTVYNLSTSTSDDYRTAYTEWVLAEVNGTTNLDLNEGFGGVINPGTGNTRYVQTVTAGGDPEDVDGLNLTPGSANESHSADANDDSTTDSTGGQISSSGCGGALMAGDANGDGLVTMDDVIAAANKGDATGVFKALEVLFR